MLGTVEVITKFGKTIIVATKEGEEPKLFPSLQTAALYLVDAEVVSLRWFRAHAGKSKVQYCINGHERTPENTRLWQGRHYCFECSREYNRRKSTKLRGPRDHSVCKHGHPLTEDNVYISPKGIMSCRECRRRYAREGQRRRRLK